MALAVARSCCMNVMALSTFPRPQWALLSADSTDPLRRRLVVPICSAASSANTDAECLPIFSSSWPITDVTRNGFSSCFSRTSWSRNGANRSACKSLLYSYDHNDQDTKSFQLSDDPIVTRWKKPVWILMYDHQISQVINQLLSQ